MTSQETTPAPVDPFTPIVWKGDHLALLDQTRLPTEEVWLACRTPEDVGEAIYRLSVRGAPAIGVSAAYGLVIGLDTRPEGQGLEERFQEVSDYLEQTRPTAVNLKWALNRGREVFDAARAAVGDDADEVRRRLLEWAHEVHRRDVETNRRIGEHGAALFAEGDRILTHCNTGSLATAGIGTALGVIQACRDRGAVSMVWVDETRPLLQGARLTTWELKRLGIPFKLVTDSSAGALMTENLVDRAVVGADRIAANGDTANKIGTYMVAVLAARHKVPFYVAAPLSTIDPDTPSGAEIPIERRRTEEITDVFGTRIAPDETDALNLAFDVTPAELIAGIITEVGVLRAPYEESIARALAEEKRG